MAYAAHRAAVLLLAALLASTAVAEFAPFGKQNALNAII
jgi:hypothetical protein